MNLRDWADHWNFRNENKFLLAREVKSVKDLASYSVILYA